MNIQTQLLNSVSELSALNIPAYCMAEIGKRLPHLLPERCAIAALGLLQRLLQSQSCSVRRVPST